MRNLLKPLPIAALAACASLPSFAGEDVGCRSTITPDGERAADPVVWVNVEDDEDRRFQDAWCVAVGPAVRYAPPARSAVATGVPGGGDTVEAPGLPRIDSLLVVAFNAHIGDADLERLVGDIRSGAFTGEPVEHFALLMQEVHRSGDVVPPADELPAGAQTASAVESPPGRDDIVDDARALGLHLLYLPSMRSGVLPETQEDRGNAILSTLPLHAPRGLELPMGLQRRVTALAWVNAADNTGVPWQLGLASAHLDNAEVNQLLGSLGAIRGRQAGGLVRMLPDEGALVVGGDFNTWFGETMERAYRRMRHHFPYPREPQSQPTAIRLGEGRVLDYLFFRGPRGWSLDDARAPSMYGSDHYPVYGWVVVGEGRREVPAGEPATEAEAPQADAPDAAGAGVAGADVTGADVTGADVTGAE